MRSHDGCPKCGGWWSGPTLLGGQFTLRKFCLACGYTVYIPTLDAPSNREFIEDVRKLFKVKP